MEFVILIFVSIMVTLLIIRFSLGKRIPNPIKKIKNIIVISILVGLSMFIAKFGANWNFPWWVYYIIPMLLTIFFPILYFGMSKKEIIRDIIPIYLSHFLIHAVLSLIGLNNYLPFIKIPTLMNLFG